MRVCVLGEFYDSGKPDASQFIACQLELRGIEVLRIRSSIPFKERLRAIRRADAVYSTAHGFSYRFFALVKTLGKRSVNHWIGTDVLRAISSQSWARQAKLTDVFIDKQLTVAPHLVHELASIDLQAGLVPILPDHTGIGIRTSSPRKVSVLTYLPDARPDFYGAEVVYGLARQFPNVSFVVVAGTSHVQPELPNIEYLGYIQNMDRLYEQAPILIRMPEHDGLPKMVLEALIRGNQVIYNYDFPYCYRAANLEEAAACLMQIIADGCPINHDGHRYVVEKYDQQASIEKLMAALLP